MKQEITSKELQKHAKATSVSAVKKAQSNSVGYTVQEGRSIVRHKADGSKSVVGTLPKAYVKPTTKRYKIG